MPARASAPQRFYEAAEQKIAALPAPLKATIGCLLAAETANVQKGQRTAYGKILAKLLGAKITGGEVREVGFARCCLPTNTRRGCLVLPLTAANPTSVRCG